MLGVLAANRRRSTGSEESFDPASLFAGGAGGAWYDPSDLSSMFQDHGGTTAAAIDAPVGRLSDKSGNGHHLVQAVAGKRPVLRNSGELYWLEFDGVDDALSSAAGVPIGGAEAQVFAAFRPSSSALMMLMETSATATNTAGTFYVTLNESPGEVFVLANTGGSTGRDVRRTIGADRGAGVTSVLSTDLDLSKSMAADKIVARVNAVGGLFRDVMDDQDGAVRAFAAESIHLGARDGSQFPFAGRFYGALLVEGALPPPEILQTERWLGRNAGLTL